MPKPGPRTTYKCSDEFKATAVRLSHLPGVQIQEVAASLYIHPFMLSRWRKQAREGAIVTRKVEIDKATATELKELRKIKRDYERLKLEHDILKKPSSSLREPRRHLRLHRAPPGNVPGPRDVSTIRSELKRLLRMAGSPPKRAFC
jgi:transposase